MNLRSLFLIAILGLSGFAQTAEKPLNNSNSWPLAVPVDSFTEEALLDLRSLNEKQSGETGFVGLSKDKNSFVKGDGRPIRFWAVGTDAYKMPPEEMSRQLRWLAKLGVNMTRLHVTVCKTKESTNINEVDEEIIEGCFRFIKIAKENGIYVLISPYYSHFDLPESWGIKGGGKRSTGLLFFNEKVKAAYKVWTREFYTRINPHTGLAIRDDPTVAVLQVQNEDSLFFWTEQALNDVQKKKLGKLFGDWLKKKHGSLDGAFSAWGDDARKHDHDDLAAGVAGIFDVYFLTQDWKGGMAKRIRDQTQFMAELQRNFYAEMGAFLRDDLGCKQLLNATNWRTADDSKLKALERWSYHALDIDAENEYVGSDFQHKGPNDGYRIDPGDYLVNESVLPKPFEMSTNWTQEDGHPFIVTETAWKNPNRYQSEGAFLAAAYQSLNGVDAIFWFNFHSPGYETDPLKPFWRIGDQMAMHKWNHAYPAMTAGFPANALLFRKGYLQEGKPIVTERRTLDQIFDRKIPAIGDNETYGDARNPVELQPGWSGDQVNRAAFQIGPVTSQTVDGNPGVKVGDVDKYFDPETGTISSSTGELLWDYRKEICKMDSPKAQGVTGFLKRAGGVFELSDVVIKTENDYATVNVVSLDDLPLVESKKVLVQVVTVNRLTGWVTEDATFTMGKGKGAYEIQGERIVRIGKPPYRIANTELRISIKGNKNLNAATILDINGYPVQTIALENGSFTLPKTAIYAVLQSAGEGK